MNRTILAVVAAAFVPSLPVTAHAWGGAHVGYSVVGPDGQLLVGPGPLQPGAAGVYQYDGAAGARGVAYSVPVGNGITYDYRPGGGPGVYTYSVPAGGGVTYGVPVGPGTYHSTQGYTTGSTGFAYIH